MPGLPYGNFYYPLPAGQSERDLTGALDNNNKKILVPCLAVHWTDEGAAAEEGGSQEHNKRAIMQRVHKHILKLLPAYHLQQHGAALIPSRHRQFRVRDGTT